MAVSIDASAPSTNPATATANTTATLVTASFTPPANTLIVVTANIGYNGNTTSTPFTISDSRSGTWNVDASEAPASGGVPKTMICSQWNTTASAMTITLTTDTLEKGKQLTIYVLDGTATASWKGGTAVSTTTLDGSVTTTITGSLVIVAACYDTEPITFTADARTTTKTNTTDTTDGLQMLTGHATATTVTPGATTLGWTHSTGTAASSYAAVEYLPLPLGGPRPIRVISTAVSSASAY